jgi:hypothetical protein
MIDGYEEYFDISYRLILLSIFAIYFIAKKYSIKTNAIVLAIYTIFIVNFIVMDKVAKLKQQPIKEAALIAKERDFDILMWGLNTPSFNVYAERIVTKRGPQDGDIALTKTILLKDIKEYEVIYQKHGISLAHIIKVK